MPVCERELLQVNVPVLTQIFKAGEDHRYSARITRQGLGRRRPGRRCALWLQPWGRESVVVRPTELGVQPCEAAFALLACARQPVELDLDWIWTLTANAVEAVFPYVCAICLISCGFHNTSSVKGECWCRPDCVLFSSPALYLSPQHYFLVVFGHDGQKPLELRSEEEGDCDEWVEVIQQAR